VAVAHDGDFDTAEAAYYASLSGRDSAKPTQRVLEAHVAKVEASGCSGDQRSRASVARLTVGTRDANTVVPCPARPPSGMRRRLGLSSVFGDFVAVGSPFITPVRVVALEKVGTRLGLAYDAPAASGWRHGCSRASRRIRAFGLLLEHVGHRACVRHPGEVRQQLGL